MTLRVAMAQIDMLVGDIKQNCQTVIETAIQARDEGKSDVIIFPELTLMGCPPGDLLYKPELEWEVELALTAILEQVRDIYLVLGYPRHLDGDVFNCAGVFYNGVLVAEYHKQTFVTSIMPDNETCFEAGNQALVIDIKNLRVGIIIGHDIASPETVRLVQEVGAQLILSLNASPALVENIEKREMAVYHRAVESALPIVYVNSVGGQDEQVFPGASFILNHRGIKTFQAPWYQEGLYYADLQIITRQQQNEEIECVVPIEGELSPDLTIEQHVYESLCLGLKGFFYKNQYQGVLILLKENLGALLSLTLAVDALGADRVQAVVVADNEAQGESSHYLSLVAKRLEVNTLPINVASIMSSLNDALWPMKDQSLIPDNLGLASRIQTLSLMTLAQPMGFMVLSATHKSEAAIGANVLYGDMAGDFALLKDVFLGQVLNLCLYRNSISPIIPVSMIQNALIDKASLAMLGIDFLSSYAELDKILSLYLGQEMSHDKIVGITQLDPRLVSKVLEKVDASENKRRQAPIGVRVTESGRHQRRYFPITQGWHFLMK